MSGILLAFLLMLATVALTAGLCRCRVRRHKPVGVGTTLAGGGAFPGLLYLFMLAATWGSPKAWHPFITLGVCCFLAALCLVPALGVVAYYQKRAAKHHDPAA